MSKRSLKLTLVASAAHLALSGAAIATEAVASTGAEAATTAGAAAAMASPLRAVRDKVTGQLRAPTPGELEAMMASERAARKARGLPEVEAQTPLVVRQHAGGMRSARLGSEYLVTLKGERRADGSVRRFHAEGEHGHSDARDHLPTE